MSLNFVIAMQIKDIKLPGHCSVRRARRHIDDLGDEVESQST